MGTAWDSLEAQTATLSGNVRTAEGEPIAARITILRNSGGVEIKTHDTTDDGTFAIEISSGGLVAAASAAGYASHELELPEDDTAPSLNFVLHELQVIKGNVRDGNGIAQAGLRVRVRYLDSRRRLRLDDGLTATTDETGAFTLAAAVSGHGRFVVDALADDWIPKSSGILGSGAVGATDADGDDDLQTILIELESRGSRVTGQVTSTDGTALANVPVLVAVKLEIPKAVESGLVNTLPVPEGIAGDVRRPFGRNFLKRVQTDSEGRFEARGLPSGSLAVVAIKRGVQVPVQRFTSTEGGTVIADFVIPD